MRGSPDLRAVPRVLSIAGTDPTGGAGIQADLKSIAANGGYGMAVVTALVAQNTHGVRGIHQPPAAFLREQLDAVSDDVEIDAVKIGMLSSVEIISTVSAWLDETRPPVVVLDPVMVASSGDRLLDADAEDAVRRLARSADLVTPNLAELAVLAGEERAGNWARALDQGLRFSADAGVIVLVKGGHLEGGEGAPDALVDAAGRLAGGETVFELPGERVETRNTHGTGCSLSSAMATRFAQGGDWTLALGAVKAWMTDSLRHADELEVGRGHGPINHFHGLWSTRAAASATTQSAAPGSPTAPATSDSRSAPSDTPSSVPSTSLPASSVPSTSAPASSVPATSAPAASATASPAPRSFSEEAWEAIAGLRAEIDELPFVRRLADGTLERDQFLFYLAQDSLYLREYSRVLARLSQLAPSEDEQLFWARGAASSLDAELELHKSWLAGATLGDPAPATRAYNGFLLAHAERSGYAVLLAAVLPCFWIYQDIGTRLHEAYRLGEPHAYGAWIETYTDEAFADATAEAITLADRAALTVSPADRQAMLQAFAEAATHEKSFFAAPTPLR